MDTHQKIVSQGASLLQKLNMTTVKKIGHHVCVYSYHWHLFLKAFATGLRTWMGASTSCPGTAREEPCLPSRLMSPPQLLRLTQTQVTTTVPLSRLHNIMFLDDTQLLYTLQDECQIVWAFVPRDHCHVLKSSEVGLPQIILPRTTQVLG